MAGGGGGRLPEDRPSTAGCGAQARILFLHKLRYLTNLDTRDGRSKTGAGLAHEPGHISIAFVPATQRRDPQPGGGCVGGCGGGGGGDGDGGAAEEEKEEEEEEEEEEEVGLGGGDDRTVTMTRSRTATRTKTLANLKLTRVQICFFRFTALNCEDWR